MTTTARITLFVFLYVALFIGAMATITGGVIDIVAWASAPVILSAEVLVLGMIYMTTFHGEAHEEHDEVRVPKLMTYSNAKFKVPHQQKR